MVSRLFVLKIAIVITVRVRGRAGAFAGDVLPNVLGRETVDTTALPDAPFLATQAPY